MRRTKIRLCEILLYLTTAVRRSHEISFASDRLHLNQSRDGSFVILQERTFIRAAKGATRPGFCGGKILRDRRALAWGHGDQMPKLTRESNGKAHSSTGRNVINHSGTDIANHENGVGVCGVSAVEKKRHEI